MCAEVLENGINSRINVLEHMRGILLDTTGKIGAFWTASGDCECLTAHSIRNKFNSGGRAMLWNHSRRRHTERRGGRGRPLPIIPHSNARPLREGLLTLTFAK